MTLEGITFEWPVPEDRYLDVIVHLRHNFFADEPINRSVQLCEPGQPHAELEEHSLSTLKDGMSVMALDTHTGEVIGVALNGVQHMGDLNAAQEKLETMTDGSFKQIFGLLYSLNQTLDLFSKYEVENIFECRILSVDSRFRGRGLAKELMSRSETVAKDAGFKVFKEDATGLFSQKIAASLGHETVYEMEYSSYTNKDGEIIFNTPPPHNSLKIMVKLLQ
ncbi:uncharacterized protein LOC111056184 [Nilaparvata lugens]|uniref:uncharacterized protein LOC111056184 n=1 Tax=Nilaparvata lugens TaxID=108931 RepID=UPI00193CE5D1|nr:uncharacterized protein LOC111056184 [Nilaparvata lugens]XP_039293311.1 uncharacterized protein LOC111056184 [Nilaparvata lugens]